MKKLFGTDGVRGIANQELTPELAFKLGMAGAYVLTKDAATPKILVAKDGRRSGDMLEAALTAGLCAVGAQVYQCGVIPTPAVAYLIKKYGFDAGVMISASHNPMADNGIKFFNALGLKLPDQLENEIESLIADGLKLPRPTGAGVGAVESCPRALEDYGDFIASTAPGLRLDGMKVALDCANGATSAIAPKVFEKL
ncbi:MAG: phosphoglucosamine mutase, partial [Defluviitaleaceae bacterium]|nr:phosphoglucosamine mutase [Defluviitaleaceae bacterium]